MNAGKRNRYTLFLITRGMIVLFLVFGCASVPDKGAEISSEPPVNEAAPEASQGPDESAAPVILPAAGAEQTEGQRKVTDPQTAPASPAEPAAVPTPAQPPRASAPERSAAPSAARPAPGSGPPAGRIPAAPPVQSPGPPSSAALQTPGTERTPSDAPRLQSPAPTRDRPPPAAAQPPQASAPERDRPRPAETARERPSPVRPVPPPDPAAAESRAAVPGTSPLKTAPAPDAAPAVSQAVPRTGQERPAARELPAEVGKIITVRLPGIGWIFLGDDRNTGNIRYQGREILDGSTIFSFLASEKGDYTLRFQQQDLAVNTIRYDAVRVFAAEPGGPPVIQAPPVSPASAGPAASSSAAAAPPLSVPESRTAIPPNDPAEAPAGPPAPDEAVAAASGLPEEARFTRLLQEKKLKESLSEIEGYIRAREDAAEGLDEWYFALAELFEKDPDVKNMKKALWYYERIRDRFPLSPHWDAADIRSRYIRVNFFEIR